MIGYLKGTLREVNMDNVLLDVQGVGYEINVPTSAVAELMGRHGASVDFWISTQVREDAIQLFGFLTPLEKKIFLSLLKVNGVGPKLASNILSGASVKDLLTLIETEDAKGLSKLPKVGKKTAEQIILTLKGKMVLLEGAHEPSTAATGKSKVTGSGQTEISSALVHLGFRPVDVDKVVQDLPRDVSFEDGVRQGLQALTTI